jgi:hypothetical protein
MLGNQYAFVDVHASLESGGLASAPFMHRTLLPVQVSRRLAFPSKTT